MQLLTPASRSSAPLAPVDPNSNGGSRKAATSRSSEREACASHDRPLALTRPIKGGSRKKPAATKRPVSTRKKPAARTLTKKASAGSLGRRRTLDSDSSDSDEESAPKVRRPQRAARTLTKKASAGPLPTWIDPRRCGPRGGNSAGSAALKRDEDFDNATLAFSGISSALYARVSNDLTDHTFNSFHKVPRRNDDQRGPRRGRRGRRVYEWPSS